jgi:uncharacterized membrane protein YphA (DoxX/SURF4 family)
MRIPIYVLTAILAAGFVGLAVPKLTGQKAMLERMAHIGVSASQTRLLGLLELAAVAGVLLGLFWWPLAVAATVGVTIQMIAAVVLHARAKDPANIVSAPIFFLCVAVGLAVLHVIAR